MSTQRRWSGTPIGRLAVMGAGQIGGSVALAARAAGAVTDVVAWSRTREKLERAVALGIIDRAAPSAAEAARGAALIVLAAPVRSLGDLAAEIAPALAAGAVVIDVGSVKAAAIAAVEPKLPPGAFVACHPVAGTERVGPDAASPLLFEGKKCVICPTARSAETAVATIERLWSAMGAEPVRMDAQLHDRVLGAGSHLPHVAAYTLAAALGGLPADVHRGDAAVADDQLAGHDARGGVEPSHVARHLPGQPGPGAAADRRAGRAAGGAASGGHRERRPPHRTGAGGG